MDYTFYARNVGKVNYGKKTKAATDKQIVDHLEGMKSQFGGGVLEPFEVRLLAHLTGKRVPPPPRYHGGCA